MDEHVISPNRQMREWQLLLLKSYMVQSPQIQHGRPTSSRLETAINNRSRHSVDPPWRNSNNQASENAPRVPKAQKHVPILPSIQAETDQYVDGQILSPPANARGTIAVAEVGHGSITPNPNTVDPTPFRLETGTERRRNHNIYRPLRISNNKPPANAPKGPRAQHRIPGTPASVPGPHYVRERGPWCPY